MPTTKMSNLSKISESVNQINVSVGKIEEHLKTLNGTVARHELNIGELYTENKQQSKSIAKIVGVGVSAGAIGGVIVLLVQIFITI